jgi:hypothetical protein
MRGGQTTEASPPPNAFTIYRRIQVPAARRVDEALESMPG